MSQKRLDILLSERGLAKSREHAQAMILAGEVWTDEQRLEKAGMKVDVALPIEIRARTTPFVSRAGQKLHHALDLFGVSPEGKVCLDIGASTGGFTDCLLKRGASHVFAIDVGYGQIDVKLRNDARVTVVERTNARYLTPDTLGTDPALAREIRFLCMDVSFISISKIIEPIAAAFPWIRNWVLLFKPQFEVGPQNLGKGGVVKSEEAVREALAEFAAFMTARGFIHRGGPESSPISGKKSGNLEYLVHYELP
jgi:23S rRNA (cytidine1920-2'-O)/16S rRNA (cytidine1409-2'-O)-methyltransferase